MVLISSLVLILNNDTLLNNFVNIDNQDKTVKNNVFIIIYISLLLMFTAIPAILVAIHCNPNNKILSGLIGFFFGDIYLLQWSIRKFVLKHSNYCKI